MVNDPVTIKSQNQLRPKIETKGFASFDKSGVCNKCNMHHNFLKIISMIIQQEILMFSFNYKI